MCIAATAHDQFGYQGLNTTCQNGGTCVAPFNCSVSLHVHLKKI